MLVMVVLEMNIIHRYCTRILLLLLLVMEAVIPRRNVSSRSGTSRTPIVVPVRRGSPNVRMTWKITVIIIARHRRQIARMWVSPVVLARRR